MKQPKHSDAQDDRDPLRDLSPETVRLVAQAISKGMESDAEFKRLPIPIRALIAASLLTATDQPVNQSTLAAVGRYSRSTAHRQGGWSAEIDAIIADGPDRFTGLLDATDSKKPSVTALRSELDAANAKLAEERRRRKEAERQLEPLVSYARDLSRELRDYREEERATLERKLHALPSATDPRPASASETTDEHV